MRSSRGIPSLPPAALWERRWGQGRCPFQLQCHRPFQYPPSAWCYPNPPKSSCAGRQNHGEQHGGEQHGGEQHGGELTSQGLAQHRLSRGAVTWGERLWQGQSGGMH